MNTVKLLFLVAEFVSLPFFYQICLNSFNPYNLSMKCIRFNLFMNYEMWFIIVYIVISWIIALMYLCVLI